MMIRVATAAATGIGLLLIGGAASAQSLSTNAASYNGGYGRANGQENRGITNYSNRDANGNLLIVDGIIQGSSSYASADATGAVSFSGGVGTRASNSASAIGNNLNVVTQGNNNTVIINSTQINNGNIYAGAGASGGVGNAP